MGDTGGRLTGRKRGIVRSSLPLLEKQLPQLPCDSSSQPLPFILHFWPFRLSLVFSPSLASPAPSSSHTTASHHPPNPLSRCVRYVITHTPPNKDVEIQRGQVICPKSHIKELNLSLYVSEPAFIGELHPFPVFQAFFLVQSR